MTTLPNSRVLPLKGASNFRDLGGYRGIDGHTLRWGRVYRSDHLAELNDADRTLLQSIGLRRSLDFRGERERSAQPYHVSGITQWQLPIEPSVVQRMQDVVAAGSRLTAGVVSELMKELYRALVNEQSSRFAEFFEIVLQEDSPVVFHCTAGKDRTGFAAALLLSALGVQRQHIMEDYLLTNAVYRHPPITRSDTPPEALAVLWTVQASFLEAAWDVIDRDHGGMERYLSQQVRLSASALQTLRNRLLERP